MRILSILALLLMAGCLDQAQPPQPTVEPTFQPVWPNPVVLNEKKCKCSAVGCTDADGCKCDSNKCTCKRAPKKTVSPYVEARKKALERGKPLLVWVGQPAQDWHWAEHVRVPLGWWKLDVPCVLVCIPKDGDLWCHETICCDLDAPDANTVYRAVWFATHPELLQAPEPVMQQQGGFRGGFASCGPRG